MLIYLIILGPVVLAVLAPWLVHFWQVQTGRWKPPR